MSGARLFVLWLSQLPARTTGYRVGRSGCSATRNWTQLFLYRLYGNAEVGRRIPWLRRDYSFAWGYGA